MFNFGGSIRYSCDKCGDISEVSIDDFEVECIGSSEEQMGPENLYEILYEFNCSECNQFISLKFEAAEYPVEFLDVVMNYSKGASTDGEPYIDHMPEIYCSDDVYEIYDPIRELIFELRSCPYRLRELSPREFEEVIAEIFRSKGFVVDLTKRTRDGGKDIIAIHTDKLGIKSKYFVECKRYSEDNKVGVDIVRALHGVKNTKDGPNKTILATTSTFTNDARKFVENEAASSWDITLADFNDIVKWLHEYD